jgi:hypothetical protein
MPLAKLDAVKRRGKEAMQILRQTKRTERTWKRQRGFDQQFHLDGEELGHRIAVHAWLEDGPQGNAGEVTVSRISGDAWRRPNEFVTFEKKLLKDPTDEEIEATVREMAEAA